MTDAPVGRDDTAAGVRASGRNSAGGGGVAYVVMRFGESSRLSERGPALLVVLAVAWQYRAPLLGRVWYFEDIASYFVPLYSAAARAMRSGQLPLWDPGAWGGQAVLGDPQVGCFYPPNWAWLALSPVTLYAWVTLLHAAVGAAGMWALARARGRSSPAAAVAAVTLSLGAFHVLQVRHAMFTATIAWLPWILWAIERYAAARRPAHLLALSLAGAITLLAGGWSMLPYGALVVAVVAAGALARSGRWSSSLPMAGAAALSLGIAAVQIAPTLAHTGESPRALGLTRAFASSYAWPSWEYALALVQPNHFGDAARRTYTGAGNQWELCGYGVGLVATLLALASLRLRERRGERAGLLLLTLAACDAARGDGGVVQPLLHHLPIFGSLRCPARALFVWSLAAPMLAADGVDALLPAGGRRAWAAPVALVLVTAELVVTWLSANPSMSRTDAQRPPDAIAWLRAHGATGRVTNDPRLPTSFLNLGLTWGLEGAGGYHSLPIWRYLHLLWIANQRRPYPTARIGDDLASMAPFRLGSPIVDLLGVRWAVVPADRVVTSPGYARAHLGSDGTSLWNNREAYPRAFVVFRARSVAGEAAAARAVADPAWRPSHVAVVEEAVAGVPEPADAEPPPPRSALSFERRGTRALRVVAELDAPGVLVVAEPWYPGWEVRVDGRPTRLLRVDYALRGVALGPGRHVVEMSLSSTPLRVGAAITVAALCAAVALAALARRAPSGPT